MVKSDSFFFFVVVVKSQVEMGQLWIVVYYQVILHMQPSEV